MSTHLDRKPSLTAEELTPIVMSQLQTTNKLKEESRRQRLNSQRQKQLGMDGLKNPKSLDSGSESCGEESRKRTAQDFISGIQSAISASIPDLTQVPSGDTNGDGAKTPDEGLSDELVSEVESVLSRLMSSVNKGDPNLVPLIANLQSSLKATRQTSSPMSTMMQRKVKVQMPFVAAPPDNQESLSPKTPNSAQKNWTKDPFGSLPKRPQVLQDGNFGPVHSKTFEPNPTTEFESAHTTQQGVEAEVHAASKIPWKIRAARKRQMKHHTTGMTKDEFAQIQQSLRESAAKLAPKPVESYNLTRNKSEGSIQSKQTHNNQCKPNEHPQAHPDSQTPGQLSHMPASYRQLEGNRAYADACKGVDNMLPPSDLGYASDVCDYNVTSNSKGEPPVRPNSMAEDKTRRNQIQEDHSYLQQKRPLSMVSLKPLNRSLESALFDRRQRIIQQRASVFQPKASQEDIRQTPTLSEIKDSQHTSFNGNRQESFDNCLVVPEPQPHLTRQSSTEEEGSRSTKLSRKNSKASSSGVKAKIARRKIMRNANAMDGAQVTFSDPEGNSETNEGEDSVEEKQDNELINEKQQFTLSNFTPTLSKKNWSSRFSNIKNSFDNSSALNINQDESNLNKSRSPSVGRQSDLNQSDNRGRSRTKDKATNGSPNTRSRSAHNLEHNPMSETRPTLADRSKSINRDRAKSKDDKNKLNAITAHSSSNSNSSSAPIPKEKDHSGRDSVDYHQYLEMIERFRGNNPKIYSHPLQKNTPANNNTNALVVRPQYQMTLPPAKSPEVSPSREFNTDAKTKAEVLGLIKAPSKEIELNSKTHDMDYQEYMNIVNKVRATKEFTKLRTEQLRLSSMYDQERDRQQELKKEEERLHMERAKIEQEEKEGEKAEKGESRKSADHNLEPKTSWTQEVNRVHMDRRQPEDHSNNDSCPTTSANSNQGKALKRQTSAEMRRLDEIHRQQLEQQKQQELRELQVRAEQERLAKLREEQIKQEKEREEIRRLEFERLQQIQEEQRRLEYERRRHEEQIRQEQQRLEEQRKKHEQLQAERNAQYNRQRLDMEAQNFASTEDHRLMQDRLRELPETTMPPSALSPEEALIRERLLQQDRLREEHRREEAQIRQEKLNLIHQEEMLLTRQDEMLRQIATDRETLTKQENLIRSRQFERLQQVRQEKVLLEKQEEMLKMREQQLVQEQLREEKLRSEQRILREQEEAIRKRQEEISKELMMGDLSDTGSESITICHPREGQVFMGKKIVPYHQPEIPNQLASAMHVSVPYQSGGPFASDQNRKGPEEASGTEEDTLDEDDEDEDDAEEEGEEDYYQTQVEVQSKHTSVPTSVRTIETKLDNPPWAQVTPYLSYSERQGQEEINDIFRGAKYTQAGVVTSPESMRASTTIITTPESSLQSQLSQNDALSISSSNPGSPPPPVPPLPMDGTSAPMRMPQFNSFVPVQPEVPPRNESFAATAGYSNDQVQAQSNTPYQVRRSLVEATNDEYPPNAYSPKIGGPGSAFKPYESTEPLFDPGNSLSRNLGKSLMQKDTNNPAMHSKVKELRKPFAPPFSTTDTEPEMKECHMNTIDKKKIKQKLSSYSTSETEEEFQAYLKSRSKWHGKGGHKNSWDPLLLDSPPQITQKPLGIIPKPTPHAPVSNQEPVERGTQMVQTPIFIPPPAVQSQVNPIYEPPLKVNKPPTVVHRNNGNTNGTVERIQKSSSIIEVRSKNDPPSLTKERSPGSLPQSIADMNSKLEEGVPLSEAPTSNSMIPWAKTKEVPTTPASSVKIKQERFQEQPEATQQLIKANAAKKPMITHQRTNPTIAAMEIMTRKELALNEMEERRAREGMRKLSGESKSVPQVNNQVQGPKKGIQRQNEVISYALLPHEPRKIAETSGLLKRFEESQQAPLVTPHPSQIPVRALESHAQKQTHSVRPNNSIQTQVQEAPIESRANGSGDLRSTKVRIQSPERSVSAMTMSSNKSGIANTSFMVDSPQPQRKLVATVKPSTTRVLPHEEDSKMTSDMVKKFAEKFETGQVGVKESHLAASPLSLQNSKLRSKSIGNNLSQKMMELEEEKERIEASSNQNKTILPWANSNKAPVLRKRDAIRKGYELRMSKSSDHITAAKMLAEARLQENKAGLSLNRDMSKSIERQIDVYTKTKDDIRKILQFAKVSSVNDRIKMKPKMIQNSGSGGSNGPISNASADSVRGVPGAKLRINQRPGEEYKSEIRSILRNSSKYESLDDLDSPSVEERRTSIENMPSIQSKIENYIQAAEVTARDAPVPPPISKKPSFVKSASLDRKKGPRLVHSNTINNGQTMQIYAQSATDYSATEDETPDLEPHYLKTPAVTPAGLQKSKSFAGQFECILPEDEIDAKKRQMMAFFSDNAPAQPSNLGSSSRTAHGQPSAFPPDRRGSITSISDEILGEDRDLYLHDVDAAFESLLNGEDDDEDEDDNNNARFGTRPGKHLESSRARARDLSSGNGVVGVMSSNNSHSNSVQNKGGERVGSTIRGEEVNSRRMLLPRQPSWTGAGNPTPDTGEPSPSPTQSVTRPSPVLGATPDDNSPLHNLQGLQGEVRQIPSQGPRMAATPNGSRLTRQASMPLSSFTGGQQVYSFNRPPQPLGGTPGSTGPGQIGNRSSIARSATSAKETILTWVQQQVNHYNNVNVTNFSTCWNDGLAFCALIHNFYPEAFDFDKLESRNRRYNFKLAFDVSEKYGDVCPLLDVDDMVKMTKPDWKCVFTYVQSFYRRFRNGREKISPKRTLALQRSPDREDPTNH
ncbi:hypothetical protein TCAL_12313 [Tigriopus californicus]|uniref:Calponin-homology (CH) domain-containing protein n=1 Tax=Tigriopus californicus TaxID=6832 RepID=A0A553P038_TIGCA|nr:hypothetical protein TCAL_12313 [Tigriopus californicus]|eukprot:TCALIF_12313-PA protein Name:"Similar to SMTN Smoothelin (Homo sapiens)" AED:0.21 eAED:0.21 QI:53/0.75/0.55/0.88/0.87/0.77/9/407/2760